MSACNARPPEGHPLRDWGVACHLPSEHLDYGEPHSWDIDAAVARHEIVSGALTALRDMFPERKIERFDNGLPHPIAAYDVDEQGQRAKHPYRVWDLRAGPWLVVRYTDGEEFAIWKVTGDVYRVGSDGAVDDEPVIVNVKARLMSAYPQSACTCPWHHADSECPVHGNP